MLKLQNPLIINRVVDQTPADTDAELYAERRAPPQYNNNRVGGGGDGGSNNGGNDRGPRGRGAPRSGPVASTGPGGRVSESTSNKRVSEVAVVIVK